MTRKMNVETDLKGNFMDSMLLSPVCERNVKKILMITITIMIMIMITIRFIQDNPASVKSIGLKEDPL